MNLIKKENCQILGIIPKTLKRRIKRITASSEWSESRLVKEGLLRILPELEQGTSPDHDNPSRKVNAA